MTVDRLPPIICGTGALRRVGGSLRRADHVQLARYLGPSSSCRLASRGSAQSARASSGWLQQHEPCVRELPRYADRVRPSSQLCGQCYRRADLYRRLYGFLASRQQQPTGLYVVEIRRRRRQQRHAGSPRRERTDQLRSLRMGQLRRRVGRVLDHGLGRQALHRRLFGLQRPLTAERLGRCDRAFPLPLS